MGELLTLIFHYGLAAAQSFSCSVLLLTWKTVKLPEHRVVLQLISLGSDVRILWDGVCCRHLQPLPSCVSCCWEQQHFTWTCIYLGMHWPISADDELVGFTSLTALMDLGGFTAPGLHIEVSWETDFSNTIEIPWKWTLKLLILLKISALESSRNISLDVSASKAGMWRSKCRSEKRNSSPQSLCLCGREWIFFHCSGNSSSDTKWAVPEFHSSSSHFTHTFQATQGERVMLVQPR